MQTHMHYSDRHRACLAAWLQAICIYTYVYTHTHMHTHIYVSRLLPPFLSLLAASCFCQCRLSSAMSTRGESASSRCSATSAPTPPSSMPLTW